VTDISREAVEKDSKWLHKKTLGPHGQSSQVQASLAREQKIAAMLLELRDRVDELEREVVETNKGWRDYILELEKLRQR